MPAISTAYQFLRRQSVDHEMTGLRSPVANTTHPNQVSESPLQTTTPLRWLNIKDILQQILNLWQTYLNYITVPTT